MFGKVILKEMWEHYNHAKEKHPFFADKVMVPAPLRISEKCSMKNAILIRRRNKSVAEYWDWRAKNDKAGIRKNPSFENVLNAELCEIYAAVSKGDTEQAHHEIFDAIAVLLRLHEELETILDSKEKKHE